MLPPQEMTESIDDGYGRKMNHPPPRLKKAYCFMESFYEVIIRHDYVYRIARKGMKSRIDASIKRHELSL
jgi:hypothetical protein